MAATETLLGERGIVLGGSEVQTGETYEVRSPYGGAPVAVVHRAGARRDRRCGPQRVGLQAGLPGPGREGLRYAIDEMTEQKLHTFNSRGT